MALSPLAMPLPPMADTPPAAPVLTSAAAETPEGRTLAGAAPKAAEVARMEGGDPLRMLLALSLHAATTTIEAEMRGMVTHCAHGKAHSALEKMQRL